MLLYLHLFHLENNMLSSDISRNISSLQESQITAYSMKQCLYSSLFLFPSLF